MAKEILRYLGAKKINRMNSVEEMLEPLKDSKAFFDLVVERHNILKDSWLTQTGHKRPEMKKGIPLSDAKLKAADLMKKIKELTP
jgi:GTP cyclohydrolase II